MKIFFKLTIIILLIILVISELITCFIEVPKTKRITEINQLENNIKFKMPKGTHFNPYLMVDKGTILEGTITVMYKRNILYSGRIKKKFLLQNKKYIAYSLIPISKISHFFKEETEYKFIIEITKTSKPIFIELSWLYCSLCGMFSHS